MRGLLVFVGLTVMMSSAWADRLPLTGEALRQELVGSLLEIDTPLAGVVIPVRVSADGLVSGEAGPLASTLGAAHDRGRWWINNDRLCVKWFRWFEAADTLHHGRARGSEDLLEGRGWGERHGHDYQEQPRTAKVDPPSIEAVQPSTPSTSPPPSSEASVAIASVPDSTHR